MIIFSVLEQCAFIFNFCSVHALLFVLLALVRGKKNSLEFRLQFYTIGQLIFFL